MAWCWISDKLLPDPDLHRHHMASPGISELMEHVLPDPVSHFPKRYMVNRNELIIIDSLRDFRWYSFIANGVFGSLDASIRMFGGFLSNFSKFTALFQVRTFPETCLLECDCKDPDAEENFVRRELALEVERQRKRFYSLHVDRSKLDRSW